MAKKSTSMVDSTEQTLLKIIGIIDKYIAESERCIGTGTLFLIQMSTLKLKGIRQLILVYSDPDKADKLIGILEKEALAQLEPLTYLEAETEFESQVALVGFDGVYSQIGGDLTDEAIDLYTTRKNRDRS